MAALIWIGALVSLAGLAGIGWSVRLATRAKGNGQNDDQIRAALQAALLWNMAALGLSAMGLALVVVGIILR